MCDFNGIVTHLVRFSCKWISVSVSFKLWWVDLRAVWKYVPPPLCVCEWIFTWNTKIALRQVIRTRNSTWVYVNTKDNECVCLSLEAWARACVSCFKFYHRIKYNSFVVISNHTSISVSLWLFVSWTIAVKRNVLHPMNVYTVSCSS